MTGRSTAAFAVAALVTIASARPAAAVTTTERNVEASVFDKINNKRATLGKNVENEHAFMRTLAERHSTAMANKNTLGHFGFNNRVQAIEANDSGVSGWVCENVAYVSGSSITATQAASMVFRGWMNSAPHRRCMLDQEGHTTQSAGIGVVHRGNTWWATFIAAHDSSP